jgi:hypothetical protein
VEMVMVFWAASTALTTAPKYDRPDACRLPAVRASVNLPRTTSAPGGSPASAPACRRW